MHGLSDLIRLSCGVVYPVYASWKAVKSNDGPQIERFLMYWSVLGCISVAEQTIEWTVNWLPFYSQAKTIAMLWLTLPSIQGTTYVYVTYLGPFLEAHEHDIDAALTETKARARAAGLGYLRSAYAAIKDAIASAVGAAVAADQAQPLQQAPTQPPPTLLDPAAGPAQQMWSFTGSLLRHYGPAAMAAGSAVLHPMQGRTTAISATAEPSKTDRHGQQRSTSERRERRAQLEAELADLRSPEPSARRSMPARLPESLPTASSSVEHSFVGGQRFEEISAEEAVAQEADAQQKLATSWWFRQPPAATPAKSKIA